MTESLIAAGSAVIVGVLSLIGVIITNNRANKKTQDSIGTAQAVTDERISELHARFACTTILLGVYRLLKSR